MIPTRRRRISQQHLEIDQDDGGNEHPEQQQEFALRHQVGLAGFPNQLGNLSHGAVNRQVLQAAIDDHSKQQPKDAKQDAEHEQLVAVHAQKLHLRKDRGA